MFNGDTDLLPDSNQNLEDIQKYSSCFHNIIKDMENTLTEDEELKNYITQILQGYEKIKNLKKEKIDKIDEAAKTESEQREFDQHFEFLVDSIIKVTPVYYREKSFNNDNNKTEPENESQQSVEQKSKSQQVIKIPKDQNLPNKKGNVPEKKPPQSAPLNITFARPPQRQNNFVQKPDSQTRNKLNIQFANYRNPNNKK